MTASGVPSNANPSAVEAGRVNGLGEAAYAIAQTIVFGVGFTYLISTASLAVFDALPGAIYPLAVALAVAASLGRTRRDQPEGLSWQLVGTSLAALLFFLCPLLVARWFDGSFDGLWYHQHAILQLAGGWNPLRGEAPVPLGALWLIHYPKAGWILGAVLMEWFGTIEAAKSINLLAAIAAGCLMTSLLLTRGMAGCKTFFAVAAGIGVAANPVVLAQLFSSYTDGLLASLLLLAVLASVRQTLKPSFETMALLGISIVLCANTKFTAVVYLGLGLVVLFGLSLVFRRHAAMRGVVICWIAGLVLGTCVLGADPYLKNTFRHGHPFYPLFGENPVDLMPGNKPRNFFGIGWGELLVRSIFAAPKNTLDVWPVMRPPVIVTLEDIHQLANYDLRIGGFGPLFGGALLLSIALLYWMPRSARPVAAALWAGLVFVTATVCVNPEAWWARYVPQLWWFPWIVVLGVVLTSRAAGPRALALCAAGILILNAAVVGGASAGHAYFHTDKQRLLLGSLKAGQAAGGAPYYIYFGSYEGIAHRYSAAGIRYTRLQKVAELPCANPENLGGPAPVMRMCRSADAGPARKAE